MSKVTIYHIFGALKTSFKHREKPSVKVKFVFSDNPSQGILRPFYKIELSRIFIESLTTDFVQYFSPTDKFQHFFTRNQQLLLYQEIRILIAF